MDPVDDMKRALNVSHPGDGQRSSSVASCLGSDQPQRKTTIDGEKERLDSYETIGSSEFPNQNNKRISVVFSRDEILSICSTLVQSGDRSKLETFFQSIPVEMQPESVKEALLRTRIDAALEQRDFRELFSLIKNNRFEESSHQALQEIWYQGHYLETEAIRGRTLSSVDRYRLRKKYPPPKSIWDGEETLYNFKVESRRILQNSYTRSRYPSFEQKQVLAKMTGLSSSQINNWFKNRRQRENPPSSSSSSLTTGTTVSESYPIAHDGPDEFIHGNDLEWNYIKPERHLQNIPNIQQNYGQAHIYQNEDITQGSRLKPIPDLQLQPNYGLEGIYKSEYVTPGSHLQNIPNLHLQPNYGLEQINRSEDLTQRCCSQSIPNLQANDGIERIYNKDNNLQRHRYDIPNLQRQPTYGLEGIYENGDIIAGSHLQSMPNLQLRLNYGLEPISNREDLSSRYLQNIQGQLQGNYELERIYGREASTAPSRLPLALYNPRESDNGSIHTAWQNQQFGWR